MLCKFVDEAGSLRPVAIVGRPAARYPDNGTSLELTRLAGDGTRNASSMPYAVAWRAASAPEYSRLIASRAAGWLSITDTGPSRLVRKGLCPVVVCDEAAVTASRPQAEAHM